MDTAVQVASTPKPIDLSPEQADSLIERIKSRTLDEKDFETLIAIIRTVLLLYQAVSQKGQSIKKLLRRFFGARTESARNVEKDSGEKTCEQPQKSARSREKPGKKKGHGRNGAASYPKAPRIPVAHETLKRGSSCPLCLKGKVYPMNPPARVIRMQGHAPVEPVIFECERLRCNLCQEIFTAKLPEEAGEEKFDASARAIMACLKYGSGMPFYRLEGIQENLKAPLPASTQWDEVEKLANQAHPIYPELIRQGAQGDVVHNDDTTMRVLSLSQEIASSDAERKGIFTTAVVSVFEDHRIALFFTGNHHAGENLKEVLEQRATDLPPPIQMCDALSRNIPKGVELLFSNCLSHARRNFVDIYSSFPDECRHLFEALGEVYHQDAIARERQLSAQERLELHQAQSAPVIEALRSWMEGLLVEKKVEPNSGLGKAFDYMLKRWEKFTLFLRLPGAPLDNNLCERVLKRAVLNRKNSLFYRTEHGAYIGDMLMSFYTTCLLCRADPFDYFVTLQKHAPELRKHPERWLPWNYRENLGSQPDPPG